MSDIRTDLSTLVSIARLDASVRDHESELKRIPDAVAILDRRLAAIDQREVAAKEKLEGLTKGRRDAETLLQDYEARIEKSKAKLSVVKTNQEYTAALKEIETMKGEIDTQEGRMLELMDDLERFEPTHAATLEKIAQERRTLEAERRVLIEREQTLRAGVANFVSQKPALLRQLGAPVHKRYDRLLERYGDVAAVGLTDGHCDGCGTQIPPQVVVEIRQADKLFGCPACGRLLIFYDA